LQRVEGVNGRHGVIAGIALGAIGLHLVLRFGAARDLAFGSLGLDQIPLVLCLVTGGVALVVELSRNLLQREFGSDLLAGVSIITSAVLGEYLAGCLVVLMLSGGNVLER
jgi:hypothetical protein